MKKVFFIFWMLVFSLCFVSCNSNEKLSLKMKKTIQADYLINHVNVDPDATIDDVVIIYYYGEYNGSHVIFIVYERIFYLTVMTQEIIADVKFEYNNSNKITVWNEGKFYDLGKAYENNLLTKDEIIKIAEQHKEVYPNCFKEYIYSKSK